MTNQPETTVTVDALARMLSAADVEINHGDYPTWDTLAESGQKQYRQAARYLLKRLHITTPAAVSAAVAPPTDRAALRDRIAAAIWERQNPGRRYADCEYRWQADAEADADAVMAVLPEPVDRAERAEADRDWWRDQAHAVQARAERADRAAVLREAADDLATAFGDPKVKHIGAIAASHLRRRARELEGGQAGEEQPETPLEKRLRYSERRNDELRAECKRRGKIKLEQAERIIALERQVDEVQRQLGAEILRAGQAEAELRRLADEATASQTEPGTCGHRSSDGHPCNEPHGHFGYHRNARRGGNEWTSWVGDTPVIHEDEGCGAEPPDGWPGDCWCTLAAGHEGLHRCGPCSTRHDAPGWSHEPAAETQPVTLSHAERTMLTYALDQAQEHIWSRDGFTDEDQAAVTSLRRMADETATETPDSVDLPTLAAALDGLHTLIATSSRDWQTYRVDAWLWAVLCGWDCEQTEHDETCTHGALEETAAMHGWDEATVAKARRYRAAVRAVTETLPAAGARQDDDPDRIVAYRSLGGRILRCLNHIPPEPEGDFVPVTAEDLPDGGLCTYPECGVDVLIQQLAVEARQDGAQQ